MNDVFKDTYDLFVESCQYENSLTWDEWCKQPDDLKSAFLFIQFFSAIEAAKIRCNFSYLDEASLLELALQYLQKNVEIIKNDKKRFTSSYIYRVAYNCMYSLRKVQYLADTNYYEALSTSIISEDNEDCCPSNKLVTEALASKCLEDIISENDYNNEFWKIIIDSGMPTEKVVHHLISDTSLRRATKNTKNYSIDYLRDVSVNDEDKCRIITKLRDKLSKFREYA